MSAIGFGLFVYPVSIRSMRNLEPALRSAITAYAGIGRTAVLDEKKWATGVEHTARLFQRPRRRPGYGERRERRDLLHQSFDRDHAGRSMDLPTLKIAWKNSDGWPHSELKKMVVTLTAMAAIAQTG